MYEETKYIPAFIDQAGPTIEEDDLEIEIREDGLVKFDSVPVAKGLSIIDQARSHHMLDITMPQNSWHKRIALLTPTPEPIWPQFHRPFRVLVFPAVAFGPFQYGTGAG